MRKPLLLVVASMGLVLFQGCLVRLPGVIVPAPGRLLTRGEALSAGNSYCASHSLNCDLKEAHLTGNRIWKVKYRATRGDERGHVHLDLDAATGSLVRVDEKLKPHGNKHDRDNDDDHDDDDDHGHGKGKGKGKDKD